MQERRRSARAPLPAWVELAADGVRLRATSADLSVGGLGVGLPAAALRVDGGVVAEFPLPGIGLPLEVSGVVAWVDPAVDRAGVRFVDVDPGLAELVESFVSGRLPES